MSNEKFEKSMEKATADILKSLNKNMNKACLTVERDAKINCPVDMGILRASISHSVRMGTEDITGTVFSNLEYAPYVHQGTGIYAKDGDGRKTPWGYTVKAGKYKGFHWTKGQKPQPFLDKAKLDNVAKITKILAGV